MIASHVRSWDCLGPRRDTETTIYLVPAGERTGDRSHQARRSRSHLFPEGNGPRMYSAATAFVIDLLVVCAAVRVLEKSADRRLIRPSFGSDRQRNGIAGHGFSFYFSSPARGAISVPCVREKDQISRRGKALPFQFQPRCPLFPVMGGGRWRCITKTADATSCESSSSPH